MVFSEKLDYYAKLTEGCLCVQLDRADVPPILYDSMRYSLFAGGKRLRPALCLAACELIGGSATEALKAAGALEMIHTYSLIHDDLPAMDNDDLRRGKPTNHKVFGEGNAILAGDGLLSLAMVVLSQIEDVRVIREVSRGAFDMVSGQSMDLNGTPDAETLLAIHRKKTGALIRAAVLAGAYCAGATPSQIKALRAFSEHFGLLFQITDDILDATGDPDVLGKSVGKDARDEKVTFVSVYGLDRARQEAEREAQAALDALALIEGDRSFFDTLVNTTITRKK